MSDFDQQNFFIETVTIVTTHMLTGFTAFLVGSTRLLDCPSHAGEGIRQCPNIGIFKSSRRLTVVILM